MQTNENSTDIATHYNVNSFDSGWLKLGSLYKYSILPVLIIDAAMLLFFYTQNTLKDMVLLQYSPLFLIIFWFASLVYNAQRTFLTANNIPGYFTGKRYTWKYIGPHIDSINRSILTRPKSYGRYGSHVFELTSNNVGYPACFVGIRGAIGWIELPYNIPTLIIDSLNDKHILINRLKALGGLEQVQPESYFPDYFKVYQEPGDQINTLRILSPDIMMYLIENMKEFNLELHDNYIRLYAANAQTSSSQFAIFINALANLEKGIKTNRIPIKTKK